MGDRGQELVGSEMGPMAFCCEGIVGVVTWDFHSVADDYNLLVMATPLLLICY